MGIGGLNLSGAFEGGLSLPYGIGSTDLVAKGNASLKLEFDQGVSWTALDSGITYTGGFNRTKYDANGVLGYAPHNLVLQSDDLSTTWTTSNTTVTANTTVSYDGVTNADTLASDGVAASDAILQSVTFVGTEPLTYSGYFKAGTATTTRMVLRTNSGGTFVGGVDITWTAGVPSLAAVAGAITPANLTATANNNGFYRISADYATTYITNALPEIQPDRSGAGLTVIVAGSQLNKSALTSYVPTTTAAVWEPRFDHVLKSRTNHIRNNTMQGAVAGTPGNLLVQSEDIGTSWTNQNSTESVNVTSDPNGLNTADELIEDSSTSNVHGIYQTYTSSGGTYTWSTYAKANTRSVVRLSVTDNTSGQMECFYNLTTGATSITGVGGVGSWTSISYSTVDVGNGWYRCILTGTQGAGSTISVRSHLADALGNRTYNGDGTSSIYLWGAQLEAKPYVDTYVATTTSAVATSFGTVPTNWDIADGGATDKIVGTGTENGVDYVDIRWAGTPTSDPTIMMDTRTGINAVATETWTLSSYVAIVGGDLTNISDIYLRTLEYNAGGVYQANGFSSDTSGSLTTVLQRFEFTHTLTDSDTAHVTQQIYVNWDGSGAIDITLRIGLPQMERAAAATDAIKTYGGAVTVDEWRDHNLAVYSEELTNTAWNGGARLLRTDNVIANPLDGQITAALLKEDDSGAGNVTHYIRDFYTVVVGETYTFSGYFTPANRDWVFLTLQTSGFPSSTHVSFDVANGVVGTIGSGVDGWGMELIAGTSWYRCWITATAVTAGSESYAVYVAEADNDVAFTSLDQDSFYAYGFMFTRGSELLDYTATFATAVAATLKYIPVGLSVFEARTNIAFHSEVFEDDDWELAARVTVTDDSIVAPDGTTTGAKIVETAETNTHVLRQTLADTLTDDATYTFSVYLKQLGNEYVRLRMIQQNSSEIGSYFRLSTGTLGTKDSGVTATITDAGNGWYRCSIAASTDNGATVPHVDIRMSQDGADNSYLGVVTNGVYVWGAQLELGAFPTPYVKTTTATVDATVDVATMSDVSWFNQSEGTFFIEANIPIIDTASNQQFIQMDDGGSTDRWLYYQTASTDTIQWRIIKAGGGVSDSSSTLTGVPSGVSFKTAGSYETNNLIVGVNGSLDASPDTSVTLPTDTITTARFGNDDAGNNPLNGNIARITYWPHRLSDEFLQDITS